MKVTDEAGNAATAEIKLTREDSQAPTISVVISEKNVIAGVTVTVKDNQLLFNEDVAASWSDDYTTACTAEVSLTTSDNAEPKPVKTGDVVKDAGKLTITVADEFQNKASGEITLIREDSQAPTVSVAIAEKNVIAGVTVTVKDNQLLFNEDVAASWTDDFTETCDVQLALVSGDGSEKTVNSGEVLSVAGTLKLTVSDEFQNTSTARIDLTAVAVYGLEKLEQLQLQVDQEINLLQGLTFAEGLTLQKVEVEQDGVRTVIDNPKAYTPEYPGSLNFVLTLAKPDGGTIETGVNNLTVKPLKYHVIVLEAVDVINDHYEWVNHIMAVKKQFLYYDILISYLNGERYKWDNMEYIIHGEVPANYPCQDV